MASFRAKFVRLEKWAPALVQLQYPDLKKGRHRVVAVIEDRSYDGKVLGIEYGSITAWVYDRHTVNA